jgi:hypothetical protein
MDGEEGASIIDDNEEVEDEEKDDVDEVKNVEDDDVKDVEDDDVKDVEDDNEDVTEDEDYIEPEIRNNTVGMGIPHVDGDFIKSISLILPPLPEQEQIVKYLDEKTSQVDSLISITEKKIELLKQKRTSLINEAVTKGLNANVEMRDSGVEWIGEIPEGWKIGKLKHNSYIEIL